MRGVWARPDVRETLGLGKLREAPANLALARKGARVCKDLEAIDTRWRSRFRKIVVVDLTGNRGHLAAK